MFNLWFRYTAGVEHDNRTLE